MIAETSGYKHPKRDRCLPESPHLQMYEEKALLVPHCIVPLQVSHRPARTAPQAGRIASIPRYRQTVHDAPGLPLHNNERMLPLSGPCYVSCLLRLNTERGSRIDKRFLMPKARMNAPVRLARQGAIAVPREHVAGARHLGGKFSWLGTVSLSWVQIIDRT